MSVAARSRPQVPASTRPWTFAKGMAPMIAVEFARRSIPHDMRPTFLEMEKACKGGGVPAAAPAAAAAAKAA